MVYSMDRVHSDSMIHHPCHHARGAVQLGEGTWVDVTNELSGGLGGLASCDDYRYYNSRSHSTTTTPPPRRAPAQSRTYMT